VGPTLGYGLVADGVHFGHGLGSHFLSALPSLVGRIKLVFFWGLCGSFGFSLRGQWWCIRFRVEFA
jgi:hypothetical protein